MKLRAEVMIRIERLVKAKGWTQAEAARTLGVTQPRISRLLKGKWEDFSLDMLADFGCAGGLEAESPFGRVGLVVRRVRTSTQHVE